VYSVSELCHTFDPVSPKKDAFVGQASCTFFIQNKRLLKTFSNKVQHTVQNKTVSMRYENYTVEKTGL
jgi:hypothetical protein